VVWRKKSKNNLVDQFFSVSLK